jgi:hypothetical protein
MNQNIDALLGEHQMLTSSQNLVSYPADSNGGDRLGSSIYPSEKRSPRRPLPLDSCEFR